MWHLYRRPDASSRPGSAVPLVAGIGRRAATTRSRSTSRRPIAWLGHVRGDFPVTEALADELLSLPIFPGITEQQLATVVEAIGQFFRGG